MSSLKDKARNLDTMIRSQVSWWPTKEQTAKAAKKTKKVVNPGNVSAVSTIGATIEKILNAPRNTFKR